MRNRTVYCELCGKPYKSSSSHSRYCSKDCLETATVERKRKEYLARRNADKQRDPYAWLKNIDAQIKANGGVYNVREGWGK